jgi:hypothetical protein
MDEYFGYIFVGLVLLINGFANHLLFFSKVKEGILFNGSTKGFHTSLGLVHLLVLVISIRLLGWLFGAIFFCIYILNLLNLGIGWLITFIFMRETILSGIKPKFSFFAYFVYKFLMCCLMIFGVLTFFLTDFKSFKIELNSNYIYLVYFGIFWIIGLIVNKIIQKREVEIKL